MHQHSGHDHHHHHASTQTLLWTGVVLTFGFALVEALFGWYAHSLALLSDAGHMLADSLTLILAAVAAWIAKRPPSYKHSYGLGRAEVIAALTSSVIIFVIVIMLAIEAIYRLESPSEVKGGTVIIVAILGIIINFVIAWILSLGEKTLNMRAALLHVIGDLLGSVAALISGAIVYYNGWALIDPILSLFICALVLFSSIRLLRDTFSVLMEGVPPHLNYNEISDAINQIEHVTSLHDLHIWTLSSGKVILTAHVTVNDLNSWVNALMQIQQLLREKYQIDHITIQAEPSDALINCEQRC